MSPRNHPRKMGATNVSVEITHTAADRRRLEKRVRRNSPGIEFIEQGAISLKLARTPNSPVSRQQCAGRRRASIKLWALRHRAKHTGHAGRLNPQAGNAHPMPTNIAIREFTHRANRIANKPCTGAAAHKIRNKPGGTTKHPLDRPTSATTPQSQGLGQRNQDPVYGTISLHLVGDLLYILRIRPPRHTKQGTSPCVPPRTKTGKYLNTGVDAGSTGRRSS